MSGDGESGAVGTSRGGNGCANHPRRAAIGRCPGCARSVCGECATRLDGILHCRDCLNAAAGRLRSAGARPWRRLGTTLAALVALPLALALTVLALEAIGRLGSNVTRRGAVAVERALQADGR